MATMKDVAKATGFSTATISRVFSGKDTVTPATRKKIFKTAEKLGYQPNKMAAALRSGKSRTIGVIVPNIDSEVFASAIKSMEQLLQSQGYYVVICQSHESFEEEKKIIDNLRNLQVDGVIVSISKNTTNLDHLNQPKASGVGVVLFDRSFELDEINSVIINNFHGAYQATQHLVDVGCTNILHLRGRESVGIFHERQRGYQEALQRNNLPLKPENLILIDESNRTGEDELRQRLLAVDPPDGIFAHGDIAALIALGVINELGLRVPGQIALAGFGNSSFCAFLSPGLTSVDQRDEDVGKLAAKVLLNEIAPSEAAEGICAQQMLTPSLVIRGSTLRQ